MRLQNNYYSIGWLKQVQIPVYCNTYWVTELSINPNETELNKTIGSVSVDSPGHGYSMPIELRVVGGRPSYDYRLEIQDPFDGDAADAAALIAGNWQSTLGQYSIFPTGEIDGEGALVTRGDYNYSDASFKVNFVDENGSLIEGTYSFNNPGQSVEIVDPGLHYIPYNRLAKTDPLASGPSGKPDPQFHYHFNHYPVVAVSGGGGYGAKIVVRELEDNGSIKTIEVIDGGRGYFNIDSVNGAPTARIAHNLIADEENASLAVQLGGYLKEIPPCNACQSDVHGAHHEKYSHLEPWIEIWDRGRSELEIDELDESRAENNLTRVRAHAVPKVVNGKITKVIVTNSGTGYVDPVAYVRAMPPKHQAYWSGAGFKRKWRCTYRRMNVDGAYEECNHTHYGSYPPEYCLGETDEQLPYEDINGTIIIPEGTQFESLKQRHGVHVDHQFCTSEHYDGRFIARKCWGTKTSYILEDDVSYRYTKWKASGNDWLPFNAEVSVISEGGRILEIVVENEGQDYFASTLAVEGSGTGVDAIPVFDEFGVNTQIIFDDPRLKNLDFDIIERPLGAGQGFRERPWSWDDTYGSAFGGREKVRTLTMQSEIDTTGTEESYSWTFGDPILADAQGDRVVGIEILDAGIYASDLDLDGNVDFIAPTVMIDFNQSCRIEDAAGNKELVDFGQEDKNLDGYTDFIPASITAHATYQMTRTLLNHSGIFIDDEPGGSAERGLFLETPIAEFFDGRNTNGGNKIVPFVDYVDENISEYIRLNGKVDYDPEEERSYIELFIDDRFPDQFYYGLDAVSGANTRVLPTFGAKIRVTEGLPGMNWAQNEPVKKATHYAYTDQNGYYALTEAISWYLQCGSFHGGSKISGQHL